MTVSFGGSCCIWVSGSCCNLSFNFLQRERDKARSRRAKLLSRGDERGTVAVIRVMGSAAISKKRELRTELKGFKIRPKISIKNLIYVYCYSTRETLKNH